MSFANPTALLWALLAVPVVVFYVLKIRLKRVPVSTVIFWRQLFDEKRRLSLMFDYVFGRGVSGALPKSGLKAVYSRKSGRVKGVLHDGKLFAGFDKLGSLCQDREHREWQETTRSPCLLWLFRRRGTHGRHHTKLF